MSATPEEQIEALKAEIAVMRTDADLWAAKEHEYQIRLQVSTERTAEREREVVDTRVFASKINIELQSLKAASAASAEASAKAEATTV